MGNPYHVVFIASRHSGGPEEEEMTSTLYGRLAKVASVPSGIDTTRKRIASKLRKAIVILAILT
jgi:hypothetical protein